jgi:hypothetical protein
MPIPDSWVLIFFVFFLGVKYRIKRWLVMKKNTSLVN